MKKTKFYAVLLLLVFFAVTPTFVACGDDDTDPTDPTEDTTPESTPNATLSSSEQKVRLEKIAQDFLAETKESEVSNVHEILEYVSEQFDSESYTYDDLDAWLDDCIDGLTSDLKNEERADGSSHYFIEDYKQIWVASAFKGHWVETNKIWKRSDADDLSFTFYDKYGKTCVLSVVCSGSETLAYICDIEDEDWNYVYNSNTGSYNYNIYVDNRHLYVKVPEHITVKLTQDGTELVSVTVDTEFSTASGKEFDIENERFSVKTTAKVEAYTWTMDRLNYNTTNANVTATLTHNSVTLLTLKASADGSGNRDEVNELKSVNLEADVLGQLQLKGTCTDAISYNDNLENAYANDQNESAFKRYVNNANALLALNLYYDGLSTRQAWLSLDVDKEDDYWSDYTYYDILPVICFADGTSYAFEEYFTEDAFKSVIDIFNDLIEDFE